jgi:prevent-host-death family protein
MPKAQKTREMEWANITTFRNRLFEFLDALNDKCIAITKNGQPQAVLVNFEEFQRMKELAERWEDEVLFALASERLKRYEAGEMRAISYEDLFSE